MALHNPTDHSISNINKQDRDSNFDMLKRGCKDTMRGPRLCALQDLALLKQSICSSVLIISILFYVNNIAREWKTQLAAPYHIHAGCSIFRNEGRWTNSFTSWKSVASTVEMASRGIDPRPGRFIEAMSRHILLCGDSTVARLFENLPYIRPDQNRIIKRSSRCSLLEYYGLQRGDTWIKPNHSFEGPLAFGLENPFCTDCSGCDAMLMGSSPNEADAQWTYEYVPIEFARDREIQTGTSTTSQETIAEYISATYQRDLCIVNAGMHDVVLDITPDQFAQNTAEYLWFLSPHCKQIVWLLIGASLGQRAQTHAKLTQFNNAVVDACGDLPPNAILFDVWSMSLPVELHADNVHHTPIYYSELGRLLMSLPKINV